MRKLIYVPVVHTSADMGSLAKSLKNEFLDKFGKDSWDQQVDAINDMWSGIREKIFSMNLNYPSVKVYQDGLPLCGKEIDIVKDVATKGSLNYRIVLELIEKGAKLIGTEDAELLIKEYNYIKELINEQDDKKMEEKAQNYKKDRDKLLVKRDKFIATQIDKTLQEGETGILFIGIIHNIDKYLPKDIEISYLIYRLPFVKESAA